MLKKALDTKKQLQAHISELMQENAALKDAPAGVRGMRP
jgi:FtsZ-binding cell division protein ZapB